MAQVNGVTQQLFVLTATLLNANAMYITADAGALATIAAFTNTNNAPVTELVTLGFGRQAGTRSTVQTAIANDTMQIYYLYTANANATVNGHEVMSAATNGNMYGWCAYNASQAMQNTDTLNAIMQLQVEIGA